MNYLTNNQNSNLRMLSMKIYKNSSPKKELRRIMDFTEFKIIKQQIKIQDIKI